MSRIVLIQCVKQKINKSVPAKDLYISPLFRYLLKYAERIVRPDFLYILSAKYFLLTPETIIEPYNETLNDMPEHAKRKWSETVLQRLSEEHNLNMDEFILLAAKNYRKHLLSHFKNYSVPLEGLGIGEQLSWLKNKLEQVQ